MKRLKFDNYTSERVCRLVKWHGLKYFPEEAQCPACPEPGGTGHIR